MAVVEIVNSKGEVISKVGLPADFNELDPNAFSFGEIGTTGLKEQDGVVYQDFVPSLRTLRQRVRAFNEMLRDPVIGAVMFMIENTARQVEWKVESTSDRRVDKRAAEFLKEQKDSMSHTWQDFMSEALSMIPFGFSIHEIVYREQSDGMIGWKKFAPRAQETVDKWYFDDHGGIKGFRQTDSWHGTVVDIPIEKLLLFRPSSRRNNPEGVSGFMSAYKPYYFKKKIEIIEAIGIERDLAGYPVLKVPMDIFSKNPLAQQMRNHAENVVSRVRRDEQMGAVLPPGWELKLISSEGSKTVDTDRVIQRLDARIAQSVLADVILMGHGSTGSNALSDNKWNLFAQALKAWLDAIRDVLNRYAVPRLFALNRSSFVGLKEVPRFEPGPITNIDPLRLANILARLSSIDLFNPVTKDEMIIRRILGFESITTEEREEARERRLESSNRGGPPGLRNDNSTRLESPNQDDPANRVR